ncbi:MAG TPA: Ig-like domain-containing protein [Bacteroidia bacterium]|nr:Ig-like domain-containing protein [Bacteroidia bacterium]
MLHTLIKFKLKIPNVIFIFSLILFSALTIQAAPIEINTPTNGTFYTEGDTVNIHATISHPGSFAEFYINNVYIGKDTSAPYEFNWVSIEGTHLITVKENNGSCLKPVSVPVQIIVKKNVAPTVQITAPANAMDFYGPNPIDITVTAADTDGVVNRVDFYVNSVYIGSDAVPPYKISWSSIPGSYTITANAVDNKGLQGISVPIAITVYPPVNSPPTVSITSPANGDYFSLGNPISISADAMDSDGVLSNVEFFANNTSIGIDVTAPYEITWPGIAGLVTLYAKATDNDCATTTSDSIQISIVDPNSPPYIIQDLAGQCSDPTFCLPVKAIFPVKEVIGYDVVMHYNKNKVQPTGTIHFNNDLINAGYLSYVVNTIDSLGEINISVFLNSTAPSTATFHGLGQVFCVDFAKKAGFTGNDTAHFTITQMQESYANGVLSKQATPGKYINLKNSIYKGALKFWKDNSPIKYNAVSPSLYLISNIFGTDSNCDHKSSTAIQPDLDGLFSHPLMNGTSIQIERDILPGTDVQPVINGMDASLGYAVVLNDPSFIPSIYQAIALDVNMDGVISAGDLSQINQRSIKTILEFKQKWNYNNNGNSNGQLSKDWLFLDTTLLANPAYKISSTYPSNDGIGYSRYKVPAVPFCSPVPESVCSSCAAYSKGTFKGILLGDINGNYVNIPADGQIKRINNSTGGSIYLDLSKSKTGNGYIDVPLFFFSTQNIVALDFSIKMGTGFSYSRLLNPATYLNDALANEDDHQILRFTSNSRKNYDADKPVVIIRFTTKNGTFTPSDLTELTGYLNGEPVQMEVRNNISSGINHTPDNNQVLIYPNPTSGLLNVMVTENSTVQLLDLQGKEVTGVLQVKANERLQIHTDSLKNGAYILKVQNEHFVSSQQVVIETK